MKHPTSEELWAYVESEKAGGPLSGDVADHLRSGCDRCDGRIAQIRELLGWFEEGALERAPEAWVQRAADVVRERLGADAPTRDRGRPSRSVGDALREVFATLRFDSRAQALAGIRSAGALSARTLLYETEIGEVYLQLKPQGQRALEVKGRFVPVDESDRSKPIRAVLATEARTITRRVGSDGQFTFQGPPSGPLTLHIEFEDSVVVLPNIDHAPDA